MSNQNYLLGKYHEIAERRYSIKEALESVPVKDYEKVRSDVMKLLRIESRQQLNLYLNGKAVPRLNVARALDAYFYDNYCIGNVWKELNQ
jgi:hypothetical protein